MATDVRSPLLSSTGTGKTQSASSCCPPSFSRRYKATCITTKSGLFVLFLVAVINATGAYLTFDFNSTLNEIEFDVICLVAHVLISLTFLMYPVVGLVGEVCCKRFKMILIGSILIAICVVCYLLSPAFLGLRLLTDVIYSYLIYILLIIAIGIFQANALQYGVDQLDFPSSEVLSSFVPF